MSTERSWLRTRSRDGSTTSARQARWGVAAIVLGLIAAWMTRSTARPPRGASGAVRLPSKPAQRASTFGAAPVTVAHPRAAAAGSGTAATESSDAPLERDPRKPGYDAGRLYSVRMADARGLFEAEPRDEAWARQREADIVEASLGELQRADPDVRIEVTCHTGSCRLRIHSRNPYLTNDMAPYPFACLASFGAPEWGESTSTNPDAADPASDFYLVFRAINRDPEGFAAQRASTCPRYRDDWFRKIV